MREGLTMRTFYPTANPRYQAYLNSPEWKARRKAVLERCGGVCERCRKYLVDEVHHLTYDRVYNEPLEDLQGVCRPCHAFLHKESGIDPLADSIHLKVTPRVIEYWDSESRRFRRVSVAKLGKESFDRAAEYQVPMSVFLDRQGDPVFDPSRWEPYRTAYRRGRHWRSDGNVGRWVPDDPATAKRVKEKQKQRMRDEQRRLERSPQSYTSYKDKAPQTDKEVIALLRRYPRIVDFGKDGEIRGVRATKMRGVAMTLLLDMPEGGWVKYMMYRVEELLNEGEILLDHERGTWVTRPRYLTQGPEA
jgi:hypothetical protein